MYDLRIVIVEDDPVIAELLKFNLENDGFIAFVFDNGQSMINALPQLAPVSLFILDIMLPGMDGFEICRLLKNDSRLDSVPVIFLTARGTEADKVRGLVIGADDYIVKPFSIREFLARVEALLRRYGKILSADIGQNKTDAIWTGTEDLLNIDAETMKTKNTENMVLAKSQDCQPISNMVSTVQSKMISFGSILIDDLRHRVYIDGQESELTNREYELLKFLMQHRGIAYSRDQLLSEVWGHQGDVDTRTVDVHIRQIRKKIENDEANPILVETLRGFGYRFTDRLSV
jgi:two-component system alkaline phosphatase synthesis response regulator PhoP